jgi:hypothetical protein
MLKGVRRWSRFGRVSIFELSIRNIYILSLTLPKMLKPPSAQRFVRLVPQNMETEKEIVIMETTPNTRPYGVGRKKFLRERNTRLVGRAVKRRRAGVKVFSLPLHVESVTSWLVATGRLPAGESGKGPIEAALVQYLSELVSAGWLPIDTEGNLQLLIGNGIHILLSACLK